jgi:acetyl-CoA synthetase
MIANFAAMDIRPGSMGRPLPGVEAGDREREPGGGVEIVQDPDSRASWRCVRAGRRCSEVTCTTTSATRKCFAAGGI